MSAQAQMRAMLDQLMGTSRDGDTTRQRIKFSDDRVCKSHLLNCCPHDVLSGTRMDLGECLKVHDLALRADYEIASKEQDFFFELDAMDHLQSFIADCDRRTEVSKKRLAETQEEISAEVAAKAERVHELNEEIGKLLAKVEQLGAEGNVEESQKVMDEVEKARAKKREAEEVYRNSMPASSFQQQKLRVCEVCSAYLGLHDNDRRLADHFGGKLHLGFIEIREKLEELKRVVAEKQEKRNQERLKRREEREREEREKLRRSRSRCCRPLIQNTEVNPSHNIMFLATSSRQLCYCFESYCKYVNMFSVGLRQPRKGPFDPRVENRCYSTHAEDLVETRAGPTLAASVSEFIGALLGCFKRTLF